MGDVGLTKGAIQMVSEDGAEGLQPVLQVAELRAVGAQQERFRMLLSDGVHSQQSMLATQMNDLVRSGAIQKGSIVRLNEFICNTIQNRRIIIVISLDVLVGKTDIIGEPKGYVSDTTAQPQIPAPNKPAPPAAGQNYSTGSYGGLPNPGRTAGNLGSHNVKPEQSMGGFNAQQNVNNRNQMLHGTTHGGGYQHNVNNYARTGQSMHQQPPMYANRGPIAKNEAPARIIPIAALNPYQGRWTIKARVTGKGELRRYNNPRGEGKVFSFDLLDSDGGEIRATCFNTVADQFFDLIEVGRVYLLSKGSLKPAQKNFNHLNNEYEIVLDVTSTVEPCLQDDGTIPRQQFNFRPISEVEGIENNSTVDLIGLVSSISPAGSILRKNGTETQKRTLQLKDMSGRSVEVTLWGSFCTSEGQQLQAMCDSGISPVLALKAVRVNDFSGKAVGTIASSQVFVDPDFPESQKLKEWYSQEGKNMPVVSLSRDSTFNGRTDSRKTVSQIKDEGLGRSEKPDWITVKAIISFIKVDNFCYTACPLMVGDRHCSKKVTNNGDGTWRCDRCDQTFPECDYRYLLQFQIQDHTGVTWATAFQESGEEIMGVSAKELYLLKYEQQDEARFTEAIRGVLFNQHLFKLKVKEETFSDEQRVKSTVVKAEKVNPLSESNFLFGLIEKLSSDDSIGVPSLDANFASGSGMQNAGQFNAHSLGNTFGAKAGSDHSKFGYGNSLGQQANVYGNAMNNNTGSWGGQSYGGGYSSRSNFTAANGENDSNVCFKCKKPGHWSRDCPESNASSSYVNANLPNYTKQYVGGF